MVSKKKVLLAVYTLLEGVMLLIQTIALGSGYWTSWEFRYNMTAANKDIEEPPMVLISGGHAGLWSRCVEIWSSWKDSNSTKNGPERCFYNFPENGVATYEFGKICKTVTAAICVLQTATNLFLLIIVVARMRLKKNLSVFDHARISLFVVQGIISASAPLLYIVGNMAELVDHLTKVEVTAAYNLIIILEKDVWYRHDWGYWLQASVLYLWIGSIFFYVEISRMKGWRLRQSLIATENGGSVELPEASPLRT